MRSKHGTHMVDLLFSLALFCVFAATALLVVLIGANVYRGTVKRMDENFSTHTSITYVTTKIRQNDAENGVAVISFGDGIPALLLTREIDGAAFETYIYHYDGALREIFTERGNPAAPGDGQMIVEVPEFRIGRSGGTVVLTAVDADGNAVTRQMAPRCGLSGALPGGGGAP